MIRLRTAVGLRAGLGFGLLGGLVGGLAGLGRLDAGRGQHLGEGGLALLLRDVRDLGDLRGGLGLTGLRRPLSGLGLGDLGLLRSRCRRLLRRLLGGPTGPATELGGGLLELPAGLLDIRRRGVGGLTGQLRGLAGGLTGHVRHLVGHQFRDLACLGRQILRGPPSGTPAHQYSSSLVGGSPGRGGSPCRQARSPGSLTSLSPHGPTVPDLDMMPGPLSSRRSLFHPAAVHAA